MEAKMAQKLALAALALSGAAFAQTTPPAAPAAPEPDYTLSYNVGVVTDYRYRGISQSGRKPALQGGMHLWPRIAMMRTRHVWSASVSSCAVCEQCEG